LQIDGAVLSRNSKVDDVFLAIENDVASGVSPEKNGQALVSGFDLYGSVRLLDNFRVFPQEIDSVIPYLRGLISYMTTAHVAGYQWSSVKSK